ncbi:MAG TPA: TAXI family TRAP transporter solute-binding subunit [Alphaproteobacteria bacterium]|jgi:TRAP transporter TAXI family solute receptor
MTKLLTTARRGSARPFAGALFAAALFAGGAAADPIAVSTLPPGAINHAQAQVIAKVIQDNSDLQTRVVSFNSPAAILGAVEAGQADMALSSSDESTVAFTGTEDYQGKAMKNLRVAFTIMPFAVGLIVKKDSPIKTVADLKGKRFGTGWQGFKQGIPLANAMLATAGLSLKDVEGVPVSTLLRAADDFKAGKTDAFQFAVGGPKVAEIHAAIGGVRFLSFDHSPEATKRMQAVRKAYRPVLVNPLPHYAGVEQPIWLMGYHILILTSAKAKDEVVYKAVKALHGKKAELVKGHPSFGAFTDAGMATQFDDLQYHPGAVKFFKEAGIWKRN